MKGSGEDDESDEFMSDWVDEDNTAADADEEDGVVVEGVENGGGELVLGVRSSFISTGRESPPLD